MIFLHASDFLVLNSPEDFVPRGVVKGAPRSYSLPKKLVWGVKLFLNQSRLIGWNYEVGKVHPVPPREQDSRLAFIASRLFHALSCYLIMDLLQFIRSVPALYQFGLSKYPQLVTYIHAILYFFPVAATVGMDLINCIASSLTVGIGSHKPTDWPKAIGPARDSYTLAR
jgi:hypothetical protein